MYAIVKDGGHQHRCEIGRKLYVELRELDPELERVLDTPEAERTAEDEAILKEKATLEFDEVLLLSQGDSTKVGQPTVAGAKVICTILGKAKGPKVVIRWFRRRKNSRKKNGHRQKYLKIEVVDIKG